MASKPLPSPEVLRQLLRYDPESGKLFWKERQPTEGIRTDALPQWNGKWAGKEAFTSVNANGYRFGKFMKTGYLAHRIAYTMFYGYPPDGHIDHINGVKDDNRITNLRVVSSTENALNKPRKRTNTSGYTGVWKTPASKKWQASITYRYKPHHLGYFDSLEEAAAARKAAEKAYGFHPNHGRIVD